LSPEIMGLALAVLLIAANEGGYRLKRLVDRLGRSSADGSGKDGAGYLLSAALGLLGLLVAFTFSMASDRYEVRRTFVREEANAIGTAYLRAQTLDPATAGPLLALWRDYGAARLDMAGAGEDEAALARAEARRDALQEQIWGLVRQEVLARPDQPRSGLLMEATNAAFDASASRRAALEARVPTTILETLVAYAAVSAAIMGYVLAADGARHRTASFVLLLLVALAITLIMDLDRPRVGSIQVSQAPLERAVLSMRPRTGGP
jgi:membrane protein YdbS with pleckstrin-like domain